MPDDLGPVPNYNLFEAGILVPSLPLLLLLLPASFHKLTRILVLHNLMGFRLPWLSTYHLPVPGTHSVASIVRRSGISLNRLEIVR